MDLRYGNHINTYNILKYFLDILGIDSYFDKIKKYKSDNLEITGIESQYKNHIYFNHKKDNEIDKYDITIKSNEPNVYFLATLDYKTKTLSFKNYLHFSGQTYYGGYEQMEMEFINEEIEFYTKLKYAIPYLELELKNIENIL